MPGLVVQAGLELGLLGKVPCELSLLSLGSLGACPPGGQQLPAPTSDVSPGETGSWWASLGLGGGGTLVSELKC